MTAFDTINRLDDGLPVTAADLAMLAIAERHASDDWARRDLQQDGQCVICRRWGDGPECAGCTANHDLLISRSTDI